MPRSRPTTGRPPTVANLSSLLSVFVPRFIAISEMACASSGSHSADMNTLRNAARHRIRSFGFIPGLTSSRLVSAMPWISMSFLSRIWSLASRVEA